MASCEQCWEDAGGNVDLYHHLIKTRKCTPEEQAGRDARACPKCGRRTLHQCVNVCMVPECDYREPEKSAPPTDKQDLTVPFAISPNEGKKIMASVKRFYDAKPAPPVKLKTLPEVMALARVEKWNGYWTMNMGDSPEDEQAMNMVRDAMSKAAPPAGEEGEGKT